MRHEAKRLLRAARMVIGCAMTLAACSDGSDSKEQGYTVGGTLSGLGSGLTVTLLNNGANALTVNGNGSFTFSNGLTTGTAYSVTVGTQPTGQTCTVANGTGTVASANITDVAVTCVNVASTYTVGGTVSGLGSGLSVTLAEQRRECVGRNCQRQFHVRDGARRGAAYAVTVGTQPTGQTCTVTNGAGTMASANVTNVTVSCVDLRQVLVGGTISGLGSGCR